MKSLKIGYISDEHIDFYVKTGTKNDKIRKYIEGILKPEGGDILLCAGDISHYNNQTKFYLKEMTKYYNNVVFVHGNHDMYLVSEGQKKKFKKDSFKRLEDLREFAFNEPNIHFLEGSVVSIDGLKIGGLSNWYDLPSPGYIQQWKEVMNDSNLILEGSEPTALSFSYFEKSVSFDTQKFRKDIEKQWDEIEKCDILLTHICPVIIPDEHLSVYVNDRNNIFFMTDDIDRVKKTNCEIVVYGHNHQNETWDYEDIEFKTNAIGYPVEHSGNSIKHFNFVIP